VDRIYLDTSVFGGYFDPEFELWTKLLFDKIINGEIKMLYSQMTEVELERAPTHVKTLLNMVPDIHMEFLSLTNEANALAEQYINEDVVGKTSRADCIHIAIATLNNADILASWNFKHIVNVNRIRGYNGINYKNGHKFLEIRTPREIVEI
jgi:hypothetical protein